MTAHKSVDLTCNWPLAASQRMPNGTISCGKEFKTWSAREGDARKIAAKAGWRSTAGGFDFCGAGTAEDPTANHAAVVKGHSPKILKEPDNVGSKYRPGCACGWVCPEQGAAHPAVTGKTWDGRETDGTAYSRDEALKVWLELHIRNDVAGLPVHWTPEKLGEYHAQLDKIRAGSASHSTEGEMAAL